MLASLSAVMLDSTLHSDSAGVAARAPGRGSEAGGGRASRVGGRKGAAAAWTGASLGRAVGARVERGSPKDGGAKDSDIVPEGGGTEDDGRGTTGGGRGGTTQPESAAGFLRMDLIGFAEDAPP